MHKRFIGLRKLSTDSEEIPKAQTTTQRFMTSKGWTEIGGKLGMKDLKGMNKLVRQNSRC